jgi:lipopolysaccharide export system permease protein
MLSVRQLDKAIDSLQKSSNNYRKKSMQDLQTYLQFPRYLDSGWSKPAVIKGRKKNFSDLLPDSARRVVMDRTAATVNSIRSNAESNSLLYEAQRRDLRAHLIGWHEKFSMAMACMVLFLIGAPLGSIIRKGGIGTPLVFAVLFFVIFFLLNNFGKKFVKEDVMLPVYGMWLSSFILLPIGFFLIYKAMHDSQLFNSEFYYRLVRAVRRYLQQLPLMKSRNAVPSSSN